MTKEDMIEDLIKADVREIVNYVKMGEEDAPGDLRHLLYTGCLGYMNWTDEEIKKEWDRRIA